MDERTCSIDGCTKPPRSNAAEWCKMHYHRWYRHGSPHKVATTLRTAGDVGKYRQTMRTGHTLAGKSGKVYIHRLVLFENIGDGSHPCHWCGLVVRWMSSDKATDLQADHLNGRRDDNRPENLVASCGTCNVRRAMQARAGRLRAAGWWSQNDTVGKLGTRTPRVEPAA